MDLHQTHRVSSGNSKRIRPALNDHDSGDQPWIQVVLPSTVDDGLRDAASMRLIHPISLEKSLNRTHGRINHGGYRTVKAGTLNHLLRRVICDGEVVRSGKAKNKN